jgi:hypothetical protein
MALQQRADPRAQLANLRKTLAVVPNDKDREAVRMWAEVVEEQVASLPIGPTGTEDSGRIIADPHATPAARRAP